MRSEANNLNLTIGAHLSDDGDHFGCTNVQANDEILIHLFHGLVPMASSVRLNRTAKPFA